jgi:ABC-2 type transport system permease protein
MDGEIRRGARAWLGSYLAMLRFDIAAQRGWLPMFMIQQVLFGAGMAVIYGFYIGHLSKPQALFIVSGSPALAVLTAGLIGVVTMVAERQEAGSWDFIWSLPCPRSAAVASNCTVFTLLALPGIVATLVLASWRYGVTLSVSPAAVPALLLTALVVTSVAFGMALLIPNPVVTSALVNALIFVILLYSPIVFPISRLPGWLAETQRVLPIYPVAQVLRASVTSGLVSNVAAWYAVLAGWTAVSWAAVGWVVGRRR